MALGSSSGLECQSSLAALIEIEMPGLDASELQSWKRVVHIVLPSDGQATSLQQSFDDGVLGTGPQ